VAAPDSPGIHMNGAESLVRTLISGGVNVCFCQSRNFRNAFCRSARPHRGACAACSVCSKASLPVRRTAITA
jgi:hypothetical protein